MADCHSIFLTLLQSIPKPPHASFSSQILPQFLLCSALRHYRSRRQRWKQPAFCPSLNGKTARLRRGIVPFTHLAREGRMTVTLGRRELLAALGGATAAWPLAARAQQPAMPVIGFISSRGPGDSAGVVAAFHRGLNETAFVEGRNVAIEYRWAEGQYRRLPALAADLVSRRVNIIVSAGGDPAAQAAKAATATTPIVFVTGSDPVKVGLVTSLNRPEGNITGVHVFLLGLGAKRLGLLHDVVPQADLIAVLVNPNLMDAETQLRDVQEAARSLGLQVHVLRAGTEGEIDNAFATLAQQRTQAVLVGADPFFTSRRDQIVALAARYAVP